MTNSFDDVEKEIDGQRGVLDGGAFQNHERVTDVVSPDGHGWQWTCNCQHCNRQSRVTIPWSELVVASVGVVPLDADSQRPWLKQNGYLYPPAGCGKCGQLLSVAITPQKAQRCLQAGISAGKLDPNWVGQAQQQTLQRVQHLRR